MLGPIIQKLRIWNYQAGLARHGKANNYRVSTPRWGVAIPYGYAIFHDKLLATQFAAKNGSRPQYPQEEMHGCIAPATMRWIIAQNQKGINTGSLHGRMMYAHPDSFEDMLAWFGREPNPHAAFVLLEMGFAQGKTSATNAVAEWASHPDNKNNGFFAPHALEGPIDDLYGKRDDSAHRVCLMGRLIRSPAIMEWFFDNQPELKAYVQEPEQWDLLHKSLRQMDPTTISAWATSAHRAFGFNESPLKEHWFRWPMKDPTFMRNTIGSFAHNPAAQSYLVHYYLTHHSNEKPFHFMVAEGSPEVMELYNRMRTMKDPAYAPPSDLCKTYDSDKVEGLMLGLHLGIDSTAFYHHAQIVLNKDYQHVQDPSFLDLDSSVFADNPAESQSSMVR